MDGVGRRPSIPHVAALDGARGLAVAGVLLFHAGHLTGGYLGVDFFFTLSGFLITSLLLAEATRAGTIGLGNFWARRARRLLPALAILIAGVAVYAATLAQPAELAQIRGDAFATLLYIANWHQIFAHQSYFALFTAPSPLNHTWSLAIEEQFYVIWPLLFVGVLAWRKRRTPKAVLITSLVLAAGSATLMMVLYDPTNTNRVYFGTDTRAASILLGAALAAWTTLRGPTTSRAGRIVLEIAGFVAIAGLAIAWTQLDGQSETLYRGGFLAAGIAAAIIIAAATHPTRGPINHALSLKPLCALGWISYGAYLYHWPVDIIVNPTRTHLTGWPLFTLQTLITLTIATLSYRLIEQPIRHGTLTPTQWRIIAPLTAAILATTILTTTTTPTTSTTATVGDLKAGPLTGAARARLLAPRGAVRVMLAGNSVAKFLAPGFRGLRRSPPLAVLDASVQGCGFPPDLTDVQIKLPNGALIPQPPCDPDWEQAVIDRFDPDIVFWIVSDVSGKGGNYGGNLVRPCSPTFDSLYSSRLSAEVARLRTLGSRVVIVTEAYSRFLGLAHYEAATDCENRIRRKVAAESGAQLADLFRYVCPHGKCRTTRNGVTLRPDGLHYDGPGAQLVAKWLLDQVKSVGVGARTPAGGARPTSLR